MRWALVALAVLVAALIVGGSLSATDAPSGWALTVGWRWRDSLAFVGIVIGATLLTRSLRQWARLFRRKR